ncbi:MAG: hypothetical protein HC896_16315 [Bacteroidales bacterium]|nr:hypothetical protein [Bacteroidales bacterium]
MLGLVSLQRTGWRDWTLWLLGALLPYAFYYALVYLFDKPVMGMAFYFNYAEVKNVNFSLADKVFVAFSGIMVLISSSFILMRYQTKKIQARKYFMFLFLFFIMCLLYFFTGKANRPEVVYLLAVPLSFLISHYLLLYEKAKMGHSFFMDFYCHGTVFCLVLA